MTMTIVEVASGSDDGTHGSVTATTTSAVQTGDVLVIFSSNDFGSLSNLTTPSITGSPTPSLKLSTDSAIAPGSSNGHQKVWAATTVQGGIHIVSVTDGSGGDKALDVVVLRGVHASIVDGTPTGTDASNGGSVPSHVAPSITDVAQTNSILLCFDHATNGTAPATYTPPTGMTELVDIKFGTNSRTLAWKQLSASGATGTQAFTPATSSPFQTASIAIRSSSNGVDVTKTFNDAEGITDSAVALLNGQIKTEALGITDSATGVILQLTAIVINDTVGVTDTGAPFQIDRFVTMNEAEGVHDSALTNVPGSTLTASVNDTVGVLDHTLPETGPGGPGFMPALADDLMDRAGSQYRWIRLHVGPPGPTGNNNLAGNQVRQQVTWAPSVAGVLANAAGVAWDSVNATEVYTFYSMMSTQTGGVPGFTGVVGDGAVDQGDVFLLNAGDITPIMPVAQ